MTPTVRLLLPQNNTFHDHKTLLSTIQLYNPSPSSQGHQGLNVYINQVIHLILRILQVLPYHL
jgi:hypothetical protein